MLSQQYHDKSVHIVCLQEARDQEKHAADLHFIKFSSGGAQGNHGCSVWFSNALPDGFFRQRALSFQRRHFSVAHSSPRLLVVDVAAPYFEARVISGHAPHALHPLEYKTAWWDSFTHFAQVNKMCFIGLDANSRRPLVLDLNHTSGHGKPHLPQNAQLFSTFLGTTKLQAASLHSPLQADSGGTWLSGDTWHTMDYVLYSPFLAQAIVGAITHTDIDTLITIVRFCSRRSRD